MYSMVSIGNHTILYIWSYKESRSWKHSLYEKKIVTMYGDERWLNLLWSSFWGVCVSNHCIIHLKLMQCYISIIFQFLKVYNIERKKNELKKHLPEQL